jgi:hypothetical protein
VRRQFHLCSEKLHSFRTFSVNSFSESGVPLDIAPLSGKLKHTLQTFMSRAKKTLFVLSALFSLEFLSLGFFTNGIFSWTARHVPPMLKAARHSPDSAVKLDSPAKTDSRFVLERYAEQTPRSAGCLTANENTEFSPRNLRVVPLRFRIILAPKVSRYISKSVLNI